MILLVPLFSPSIASNYAGPAWIIRPFPSSSHRARRKNFWPNAKQRGLGDQFYNEMLDALAYLEANYRTPPFVQGRKDIQRYITTGGSFRWLIYFRVYKDKIVVPMIVHPSQKPRY